MLKKFVSLQCNASPSKNPYEVRTYKGDTSKHPEWNVDFCVKDRICPESTNSTISKVITIEDELRRLRHKAKKSRFQRPFKKKCADTDIFTMCVVPQRTPRELRIHAVTRECYLKAQSELNRRVHNAKEQLSDVPSLVQLNSPLQMGEEEEDEDRDKDDEEEGEEEDAEMPVKPKLASPSCSVIFRPPKKLLELRRPKSGMFHNETEPPMLYDDKTPYQIYNPRLLQEQFEAQDLDRIDIITGKDPNDLWTWNIGVQKRENDLDRELIEASIPKLDCNKLELNVYKIPKDLDKTFVAEIVFGNAAILCERNSKRAYYHRPKEIACIFIAFVESFRLNPDFWTAETIDAILSSGNKLIKKSTDLFYKSNDTDFDILSQIAEKQAVIRLKVHFTGPLKSEPNIYKALSLYFSKFNAAVLCSPNVYMLIWKRCKDSFYVFDPNGRNQKCERDFEEGKCSLMATRYVEHLVHLIVNFSGINMNDEFNLYEINLLNYGKVLSPLSTKPMPKRTHRLWSVINSTYAIIPAANNGLQQPNTGNERNPSMIVSLLALLYSDIDRAVSWRMEVIDDLIKFGKTYYKVLMKKLKPKRAQHFNIVDLPETIMLGAFKATLSKHPFLYTGHAVDCKNYLDSQLIIALKTLFSGRWEAGLLQIDNCVIALWRDSEYFYVFDPFRRGKAGQVLDPEDFLTKGVACLQMHTNFDSFCRILYQKAIKMRRGGKFFLHGINVGCIKPVASIIGHKTKYTRLLLTPPKYIDEPEKVKPEKKKGKGKKGKLVRKYSIRSLPEQERIPEYEEAEVATDVLEEVLCEILQSLTEPIPERTQLYKQADKILLRSDKAYLESLKYNLKHGKDYDNISAAFKMKPPHQPQPMTLEEELLVPSNYEMLPDGTWIIFGSTQLPLLDDDMSKLAGLLAGLVTAALTTKYKISTWNSELVDFVLESTNNFGEEYQNYDNLLKFVLSKRLPKISIGENVYCLKVRKIINSDAMRSLRQVLLESLMTCNRMLVICQKFSCIIIKRYNFLYMLIGFPCNTVGYRKFASGPGCMLRFVELDSLIRRIEFGCNPQGCEIVNYVVVMLDVKDITVEPPERFKQWSEDEQQKMYNEQREKVQKMQQRKLDKIHFLDQELHRENERIQNFLEMKEQHLERRRVGRKDRGRTERSYLQGAFELEEEEEEEESMWEEEEEEEQEVELKHKPGKKLPRAATAPFKPRPILYGYHLRDKDYLFKIQGSTCLEGREKAVLEEIKPCFFVSTLAIMYVLLRPLNQWNTQRIDRVLENGKAIASKVSIMTTAFERVIKNVTVDNFEFNILTRTYEPLGVWSAGVEYKIAKATQTRHYLLLQMSNCTYAIFRDEFYHLFDPYASMQTPQEEEEEEESEEEEDGKKKYSKDVKRYAERNTASWVLFADVESLIKYVNKRATNPDWQLENEFQLHVVDVISYKKAPAKAAILQLLTDLAVPMTCDVTQHGEDESYICAHNENLSWLDLENCLPVWSRLNRRNTSGKYRNLPVSKLKKYDIEIAGRLWSLWGNLHPMAPVFKAESRGKQYLACNVIACCAAVIYPLTEWSSKLLDTIVISGDKYHRESLANIKQLDYEFSLEDLNLECTLENIKFVVHVEHAAYGKLYSTPTHSCMNLAEALMYFFSYFQFGVLQCQKHYLAIGRTMGHDGGYFMYDCQSRDYPLFPKGQGASYILRTKHLQVLLYCIVVTLNISFYEATFSLHKVEMLREGTALEEEAEEEEHID